MEVRWVHICKSLILPVWSFLLQQICSSASYYADLLFEKMIKNNYYDEDPSQFDVSEQVHMNRAMLWRIMKRHSPVSLQILFKNRVEKSNISCEKASQHMLSSKVGLFGCRFVSLFVRLFWSLRPSPPPSPHPSVRRNQ